MYIFLYVYVYIYTCTGSKNAEEPDPLEPAIIGRLDNHYKYVPISASYYANEDGDEATLRRVLKWYVRLVFLRV